MSERLDRQLSRPGDHMPRTMTHARCHHCGRLLAPVKGRLPAHRTPPPKGDYPSAVPLTGLDSPWCKGGTW